MSDIKRVVLAYSGGLDTSVIAKFCPRQTVSPSAPVKALYRV